MKRIVFALLGAISISACAQAPQPNAAAQAPGAQAASAKGPMVSAASATGAKATAGTPEARAIEAVRRLNPKIVVDRVGPSPMKGFQEVVVQGQMAYVSDDGRYLFLPGPQGALYDTVEQTNVSELSMARTRKELLKTVPVSERIVFAPANPKHTVAVFTDVECGYCKKFHSEIAEYNRQGIAVQYLAFPRMGLGSEDHKKMISVWCSSDRRKALTNAKAEVAIPSKDCKNSVTMQYDVGQRAGLTGTPMIIAEDGTTVGGYLPPAELRQALDKLATGKQAPAASTAADPVAATGG
ncbi:DsbC family protein [Agrilutibacter solisilvae]|uniref:Thiol:disulfide interchange protein n=1 Tax=Agrilutibacter solisilvae TaxID=2763317 RepID=A0A974Y1H6_9GAMM|nr:DsbC family protein [Lysobacter solisilvae]QSX79691.1 DsbC family protein [Lysobacter solisilvae]